MQYMQTTKGPSTKTTGLGPVYWGIPGGGQNVVQMH